MFCYSQYADNRLIARLFYKKRPCIRHGRFYKDKKFLFCVGLAYETAAASAAFFGAANANGVLFAKMSVAVKTAVANVTVDFLIKFVVHNLISPLPYADIRQQLLCPALSENMQFCHSCHIIFC